MEFIKENVVDYNNLGLTKAFVACIDIIGFGAKTKSSLQKAEYEKIADILLSNNQAGSSFNLVRPGEESAPYSGFSHINQKISFSDTVFVIFPLLRDCPEELAKLDPFQVVLDTITVQFNLLRAGFASKGGIAFGDVYLKSREQNTVTFGSAVSYAHDIEQDEHNPRVILDKNFHVDAPPSNTHHSKNGFSYYLRDSDNKVFINYLLGIWNVEHELKQETLNEIREIIIKNITDTALGDSPKKKWSWIARYFNDFVASKYCTDHLGIKIKSIPTD